MSDEHRLREERAGWANAGDVAAIAAADARALADIEAGRIISHEAMTRWLRSWGTEAELPPPQRGE